jgi:hypothetical protein
MQFSASAENPSVPCHPNRLGSLRVPRRSWKNSAQEEIAIGQLFAPPMPEHLRVPRYFRLGMKLFAQRFHCAKSSPTRAGYLFCWGKGKRRSEGQQYDGPSAVGNGVTEEYLFFAKIAQ